MPAAGFEPTIPASKWPQNYGLPGPPTGIGLCRPAGMSRVRFSMVSLEFIRDLYRYNINFKNCYQSRTNTLEGENSDLVTDSHGILARKRNHFSQLFKIHGLVISGRQKYIQQNH
jgi:hypothetical protein